MGEGNGSTDGMQLGQGLGGPQAPPSDSPAGSGRLRCPTCGEFGRRKWNRLLAIDAIVCAVTLVLAPVMLPGFVVIGSIVGVVLLMAWVGAFLLSLCALPVTGAIAVATRARCPQCGYRFWPGSDIVDRRFPIAMALAGLTVLIPALVLGLLWITSAPGQEAWTVQRILYARVIMAVLTSGLALFIQAIVWRALFGCTLHILKRYFLLLLPPVILASGWLALTSHDREILVRKFNPVTRSREVLVRADLAVLPESAREVNVYCIRPFFYERYFLRFEAAPNDIEQFLAESPSLRGIPCRTYSSERMRLPARTQGDLFECFRRDDDVHDYFDPNWPVPEWYEREIRGEARRYQISGRNGKYSGELIVNDQTHTVFVRVGR